RYGGVGGGGTCPACVDCAFEEGPSFESLFTVEPWQGFRLFCVASRIHVRSWLTMVFAIFCWNVAEVSLLWSVICTSDTPADTSPVAGSSAPIRSTVIHGLSALSSSVLLEVSARLCDVGRFKLARRCRTIENTGSGVVGAVW